jgi:iron(III) transport system substrate-binding protein
VIPNSLAILAGCPHPETARQLVDFLLSAEVEAALAKGPSGQIPLQPGIPPPRHLAGIQDVEPMQVDFAAAAAYWSEAAEWLAGRFGEDAAGGGAPAEGSDPSR